MDHELSQVTKRSNTLDTEGRNGLTWQTGIVILYPLLEFSGNPFADNLSHGGNGWAENFHRVVGPFTYGNRGHTSQVLQPSIDQSTGSVATEIATSVATSLASTGSYTLPQSAINAGNQDFPPLNARKRAVEPSSLPRKQRRHSYSTSLKPGCSQLMHRKNPSNFTKVSRKLVNDTFQCLQSLSDRILISDAISPRDWATMHLATRLLQSRYEEIIASRERETHCLSDLGPPPTQPEE